MMEKDIADLILENTKDLERLAVALITLLLINIISLIGKLAVESSLKNKEIKINKASIINNRKLNVQEELYHQLHTLTFLNFSNLNEAIAQIQETERFIRKNNLFVSKRMSRISHALLDYFKSILSDPRNRNFEFEISHFDMFTDEFNEV